MKNTTSDLPPEIEALAQIVDKQPIEVQELFQYCLAIAMCEAGKFQLLSTSEVDGRWHYTFSGAGQVFRVVRPEMGKEMERSVRGEVGEILGEEGSLGRDVYLSHRRKA